MIGQDKIRLFVQNLTSQERIPTEINLLLTGKAGIGKTHAIRYLYLSLSQRTDLTDCVEHYPKLVHKELLEKFTHIPIHIIDEIHKVERFEILYDFMLTHLFIVATNIPEDLPEAFRSRCINIVLENYSKGQLGEIVMEHYDFDVDTVKGLVERSRGTPRDILQMASLININPNTNLEDLGYYKGGFRREDILYLEYMKGVKSSSLGRIAASTNLDTTMIQEFVEPFLVELGLINITNRRYINEDYQI